MTRQMVVTIRWLTPFTAPARRMYIPGGQRIPVIEAGISAAPSAPVSRHRVSPDRPYASRRIRLETAP